jgi:hypothetical protein
MTRATNIAVPQSWLSRDEVCGEKKEAQREKCPIWDIFPVKLVGLQRRVVRAANCSGVRFSARAVGRNFQSFESINQPLRRPILLQELEHHFASLGEAAFDDTRKDSLLRARLDEGFLRGE